MSSDESISDDTEDVIFIKRRKKIPNIQLKTIPKPTAKLNNSKKSREQDKRDDSLSQWIDKYAPTNLTELCIHPRKLSDLKKKIEQMISGNGPKVLLVHGPSGCSKSTSVKLLANELLLDKQLPIVEYSDVTTTSTLFSSTASSSFVEFLNECKYRVGSNMSVVLVEEFPNVFNELVHAKFKNAIEEWIYSTDRLPPLVMCITEVELPQEESSNGFYNINYNVNADTLLGKKITNHSDVELIKFNPIAMTYIKKTLNKVVALESSVFGRIPKNEVLEFIGNIGKCGDIRSSLGNLQFWSRLHTDLSGPMKKEKVKSESQVPLSTSPHPPPTLALDMFSAGPDVQLNLFHAIGKIIYGSTTNSISTEEFSSDYFVIDDVISNYSSSGLFQLALLENYGVFNNDNFTISEATEITDNLSIGDVLMNQGLEYGKEIGVRGTRSTLSHIGENQSSSHFGSRIKFPSFFKIIKEYNRVKSEILDCQKYLKNGISFQDLNLIHGFYEPKIYNSFQYKYINSVSKDRMNYNRIGGVFKQILPSEDLPLYDEEETNRTLYDQYRVEIKLQIQMGNELDSDDEDEMSDPIDDDDDDDGEVQVDSDSDFLSDEELDNLIRERNL